MKIGNFGKSRDINASWLSDASKEYGRSFREVDQHSQIAGPYIASLKYLHRDLDGGFHGGHCFLGASKGKKIRDSYGTGMPHAKG